MGQVTKTHKGNIVLTKGRLKVMDCLPCGFAHLSPLPRQSELDEHWNKLYAGRFLFEQEARQQWYWRRVYLERMFHFCVYGSWPNRIPCLLDYGAGVGSFVGAVLFKFAFWNLHGYEPNPVARSLSAWPYQYISSPQRGYYDAVHCSLVLEHALDPSETLGYIADSLVPGGVLCLVVPNEFNRLQRRLYGRGYSPVHQHHVNYFDLETLAALVERAGFKVVDVTVTFPIELFALLGLDYVRRPKLGAVAHRLRMAFEVALLAVAPGAKRRLYRWFAGQGIGREVELWARKAI